MIPKNNEIRMEVSTLCNYNCSICPREILRRSRSVMSTELFTRLLDRILRCSSQYEYVTFSGMGEPFLDPNLLTKVAIARERGLRVLMLTNGSHLSVPLFRQLEELGVESVRVSLYGMTTECYQVVHGVNGPKAFENVKEMISDICMLPRKTKVLLTFNLVEGVNDCDMPEWIQYWEPRADLIEVWRPHNWVYGRKLRQLTPEKRPTCGRPFTGPLQVQVDGTVNMCCFDFNGDLTLGDLKEQYLLDIFSNRPFKQILYCHQEGEFENSGLICEYCDQRNTDRSGVMVYNSRFSIRDRVECTSTTYKSLGCTFSGQ